MQDGSNLQVTGEAEYADDAALTAGALYAAYVPSTQPYAKLLDIDWAAALSVDGEIWVLWFHGAEALDAGGTSSLHAAWSVAQCHHGGGSPGQVHDMRIVSAGSTD